MEGDLRAEGSQVKKACGHSSGKGVFGFYQACPNYNINKVGLIATVNENGGLCYKDRVCVTDDDELRKAILEEADSGSFAIHPGSTKMYQDLKMSFWWSGMKRDVSEFVTKCLVCQRVKAEHQVPSGLLQPIRIPEWKWD